jgi:hypothetical protein
MHSIGPKTHIFGRFRLFRYCMKVDAKLAEVVPLTQNSVGPKTHVLGRSGPFYCTNIDAKLAELAPLTHKFAERSCIKIFHNERTRSTPLEPKLMFCGVSDRFVTARKSMQNWPNWCH